MHMRTTLDLPEKLVEDAQRLGYTRTKREAVVAALEEFVRAKRRAELIATLGTMRINLTHEDLRAMREGDEPPVPDAPLRLSRWDKAAAVDTREG